MTFVNGAVSIGTTPFSISDRPDTSPGVAELRISEGIIIFAL